MQTFASDSSHYLDITEMSHVDFDEPKHVTRNETNTDNIVGKDIEVVNLDDGEIKDHLVNDNEDFDPSKYSLIAKSKKTFGHSGHNVSGHMKQFLEDSLNNHNYPQDKYLFDNENLESSGSEFNSRKSSFASDFIDRRSSLDFFLMNPSQRFKDTRSNSLSSNISL